MFINLVLVVGLSILVYWIAPKVHIDPQSVSISEDVLVVSKDVKRISWNSMERKFENKLIGPESFTHNPDTGEIYTGTNDGMIWRINQDMTVAEPVLRIGEDHKECGSPHMEKVCGRVLGLKFVSEDKLIVADAYKGIIAIHLNTKTKQVLVRPDQNMLTRSMKFFNSVDVSKSGIVYFTVSSMKWTLEDFVYSALEGENSGGVYSYSLITKELKVLASNLSFANGMTLSADENSLIVCEARKLRLLKFNLLNLDEEPEIFIDKLPGFPDNIKRDEEGNYFVALPLTDLLKLHSFLNKFPSVIKSISWLIPRKLLLGFLCFNSQIYKINREGRILTIIDGTQRGTSFITEAYKINGKILFGNLVFPHLDVIDAPNS